MKEQSFALILSGVSKLTSELADALYESTGGDIELNLRDGVAYIEFTRSASTLRVVRVESESANVIAKINADLLGVANR